MTAETAPETASKAAPEATRGTPQTQMERHTDSAYIPLPTHSPHPNSCVTLRFQFPPSTPKVTTPSQKLKKPWKSSPLPFPRCLAPPTPPPRNAAARRPEPHPTVALRAKTSSEPRAQTVFCHLPPAPLLRDGATTFPDPRSMPHSTPCPSPPRPPPATKIPSAPPQDTDNRPPPQRCQLTWPGIRQKFSPCRQKPMRGLSMHTWTKRTTQTSSRLHHRAQDRRSQPTNR